MTARDQQHDDDSRHQHHRHWLEECAEVGFVERDDDGAPRAIGVWHGGQRRQDRRQFGLRLLGGDAAGEPADHLDRTLGGLLNVGERRERPPDLGVDRIGESFRHYADDGRRFAIQPYGASDDGWIRSIALGPHSIADDRHRGGAGPVLFRKEVSSEHGPFAQQREAIEAEIGPCELIGAARLVAKIDRLADLGRRGPRSCATPIASARRSTAESAALAIASARRSRRPATRPRETASRGGSSSTES